MFKNCSTTCYVLGGAGVIGGVGALAAAGMAFSKYEPQVPQLVDPDKAAPGKLRICATGWPISPPTAHSHDLIGKICKKYPDKYESFYVYNWKWWEFSKQRTCKEEFPEKLKGHCTSPFIYAQDDKGAFYPIGGDDMFCDWVKSERSGLNDDMEIVMDARKKYVDYLPRPLWHHSYRFPATAEVVKEEEN